LGATPLRRRLTSFTPTTVDQSQSCVTGLILGGVPLLASDGLVWSIDRALFSRPAESTTLLGLI
jgi:hypothetical protein